jgi:hypothetical protein
VRFRSVPFLAAVTPSGGGGGTTFVAAGAPYDTISALTAHPIPIPAGLNTGDMLVVCVGDFNDATSITLSNGQSLTKHVRQVGAIWSVVLTSVPTTISLNYSVAADLSAQAVAYRGPTAVAGIVNDEAFSARATIPYDSDATQAAVIMVYVRAHPNSATAVSFDGDAADHLHKINFNACGFATGIHNGATGTSNAAMTWSAADTGGRYLCVAFKP